MPAQLTVLVPKSSAAESTHSTQAGLRSDKTALCISDTCNNYRTTHLYQPWTNYCHHTAYFIDTALTTAEECIAVFRPWRKALESVGQRSKELAQPQRPTRTAP